jgi:hypothetical protein
MTKALSLSLSHEYIHTHAHMTSYSQDDGVYKKKIEDMMTKDDSRLLVDVADLRKFDEDITAGVLNEPAG